MAVLVAVPAAATAPKLVSVGGPSGPRARATDGVIRVGDTTLLGEGATALGGDGRWFARATLKEVVIYDVKTFRELRRIPGKACDLQGSPDGALLAVTRCEKGFDLVDVATGKIRRTFAEDRPEFGFSPNGKFLYLQRRDDSVVVPMDGSAERRVAFSGFLGSPGLSPDGTTLVIAHSRSIDALDIATGRLRTIAAAHDLAKVGYSRDGRRIGAVTQDAHAIEWDAATGAQLFDRKVRDRELTRLAFGPDNVLYTEGPDGDLIGLDEHGTTVGVYLQPADEIFPSFGFTDHELVSLDRTFSDQNLHTVTAWDLVSHRLLPLPAPVLGHDLAFRDDTTLIVAEVSVHELIKLPGGERVELAREPDPLSARHPTAKTDELAAQRAMMTVLKIADETRVVPAGQTFVVLHPDGTIGLGSGAGHPVDMHGIYALWPSPDGKWLALQDHDQKAALYALPSLQRQASLGTRSQVVWARSGAALASADYVDGVESSTSVTVWLTASPNHPVKLAVPFKFTDVFALDATGTHLAVGGKDGQLAVIDTATRLVRKLRHDRGTTIFAVAFSPDGTRLASLASNGTLAVFPL